MADESGLERSREHGPHTVAIGSRCDADCIRLSGRALPGQNPDHRRQRRSGAPPGLGTRCRIESLGPQASGSPPAADRQTRTTHARRTLKCGRIVNIDYRDANGDQTTRTVEVVGFYNGTDGWYLVRAGGTYTISPRRIFRLDPNRFGSVDHTDRDPARCKSNPGLGAPRSAHADLRSMIFFSVQRFVADATQLVRADRDVRPYGRQPCPHSELTRFPRKRYGHSGIQFVYREHIECKSIINRHPPRRSRRPRRSQYRSHESRRYQAGARRSEFRGLRRQMFQTERRSHGSILI